MFLNQNRRLYSKADCLLIKTATLPWLIAYLRLTTMWADIYGRNWKVLSFIKSHRRNYYMNINNRQLNDRDFVQ